MSYRRFTDSVGTHWRVWEVYPEPLDRRRGIRRLRIVKIHFPERRVLPERRVDMRRSRLFFPPDEPGWLTFESGDEKRRLLPIPDRWFLLDDAELEDLCSSARLIPRRLPARDAPPVP